MVRRVRQTGDESTERRARRLGQAAIAGWVASRPPGPVIPTIPDMVEAFIAGFLARAEDEVQPQTPEPS